MSSVSNSFKKLCFLNEMRDNYLDGRERRELETTRTKLSICSVHGATAQSNRSKLLLEAEMASAQ